MDMYYITAYMDEKAHRQIQHYINRIAEISGNEYMIAEKVPPHITLSAFECRDPAPFIPVLKEQCDVLKKGQVKWVSVGAFFPYVLFLTPILNEYLQDISRQIYDRISRIDGVLINQQYQPLQWMPHTTLGKKLSKEEMAAAFAVMQDQFAVCTGEVIRIGLAKPNPHRDLAVFPLQNS